MVRIVSQETYDEVVKENMEEFDMPPEEAIKEAIAQFEAQGVNLSNIIKDLALGSGDNPLITTTVSNLKDLCGNDESNKQILKELDILKAECNKDMARRMKASKDGAYGILIDFLDRKLKSYTQNVNDVDRDFIVNVLSCLNALMDTQPDLLDGKGIDIIQSNLNVKDDDIITATLKWASTCCLKHEMNRQGLFNKGIANNLKSLLDTKNTKVLSETLRVTRRLTLDDDIRMEFGKAHDHAREMGKLMLEQIAGLLKVHTTPPLVSELLSTTRSLCVRAELCASAANAGGANALFAVLAENYENASVTANGAGLITALAGNDDVKRTLVNSGVVPVIVSLLDRHSSNASCAATLLKCASALSLREPSHGIQFLDSGAAEHVLKCMQLHPDDANVQKNGCWAIRNMVSRCRDYNDKFREQGAEAILNAAYERFANEFGFDVKSALRDLECDVKLDEQWTGTGKCLEQ